MLLELMSSAIASMVVEPAKADLREALASARRRRLRSSSKAETCLREGAPLLITKAGERPAWAVTSVRWASPIGWYQPEEFLSGRPSGLRCHARLSFRKRPPEASRSAIKHHRNSDTETGISDMKNSSDDRGPATNCSSILAAERESARGAIASPVTGQARSSASRAVPCPPTQEEAHESDYEDGRRCRHHRQS
jgi:hypothetical protein